MNRRRSWEGDGDGRDGQRKQRRDDKQERENIMNDRDMRLTGGSSIAATVYY